MNRCTAKTSSSKRCKRHSLGTTDKCWNHADSCPVCLEKIGLGDDTSKLQCGHAFHASCIYKWLDRDTRCPMCRADTRREHTSITINYEDEQELPPEPEMLHILRGLRRENRIGGEVWIRRAYTFFNERNELVATMDIS
jgi:hypothetical protein